jgi:hypothetical protein
VVQRFPITFWEEKTRQCQAEEGMGQIPEHSLPAVLVIQQLLLLVVAADQTVLMAHSEGIGANSSMVVALVTE